MIQFTSLRVRLVGTVFLAVAPASLRHRIILNFEGEADAVSTDEILQDVIASLSEKKKPVSQ